jgi:hypothetical protein
VRPNLFFFFLNIEAKLDIELLRYCFHCSQYEEARSAEINDKGAPTITFAEWIREAIDVYHKAHPDMDRDTYLLLIPPIDLATSYKAMKAYGYHYRVLEDSNTEGYVTYDSGLIVVAQHMAGGDCETSIEIGYVGELLAIYQLDYGGTSEPVILLKGQWVRPEWRGARCTMMRDSDGLLLANFNRASTTSSDPFVFPSQVQQAFYLDVEERPGWRVVCHRQPRDTRISGDKMVFSLDDHSAFDHPLTINEEVAEVGTDYIPLTTVDVWTDLRDDSIASDEDRIG